MSKTALLKKNSPQTNSWGIDLKYEDALGNWHDTKKETVTAIIRGMGADPSAEAPSKDDSVIVIRRGQEYKLPCPATVQLEDETTLSVSESLRGLPLGYHQLLLEKSQKPATLIVAPEKCWLPGDLKTWGWAVQLYAARSKDSWGIGDFADLYRLAKWSAEELHAGMMLVNPLSAASPLIPQQPSPYFPTSRAYLNLLWLHIESIPGASSETIPGFENLVRTGHELNGVRLIDRDRVFQLKMKALEALWSRFQGDPEFDQFCRDRGEALNRFAVFCALADHHQCSWHTWPEQYRHPFSQAVSQFARDKERRVQFFKWLQWQLDRQLAKCADLLALMQDLPIGVDPDGADGWIWQDVIAHGVGVGAPPDEFNTQGQNWGLPPFVPYKLRASAYQPLIETVRAAFRHGGGLRIDHVMGLFRLFWIPQNMSADRGAYVRYNADEMLAVVALESVRARAYVVGEDLGTVEESAREKLSQSAIMSYRLLWFEKDAPKEFPRESLSAVTTHDLPTVSGLWTGSDLQKQQDLGLNPNEEGTTEIRDRLQSMAELSEDSPVEDVILGAYTLLAKAPSRIVTAALDDAARVEERPNVPATTSEQNPNWSLALPIPIEELITSELPVRIAQALRRA